jgi:hypothetical protein
MAAPDMAASERSGYGWRGGACRLDARFVPTVGEATHRGHLVAEARCIGAIVPPERMGRPTYPGD